MLYSDRPPSRPWRWLGLVALGLLVGAPAAEGRQELEPGAYSPAPAGMNAFVVSNSFSTGDLAFDPAVPIDEANATINLTTLAYARTLGLFGRAASVGIGAPIAYGNLSGFYLGEPAEATRFGPGDPRARIAVNLYGARALTPKEFVSTPMRRLVGASLTISMPLGQYSQERVINIGNHRWGFKPELGMVSQIGRWTLESMGGVWLFTRNSEFYRGSERTQQPIGSLQFHLHYAISPRLLVSGNTNFYWGGRTTVNGRQNFDLQRNSRLGGTLSRALAGGRTLRVAVSRGAYTTIGGAFTNISAAFQQVWR